MMRTPVRSCTDAYLDHVNPQWVKLLSLLEMNVSHEHCLGTELYTADGRRILDFLSGYCVHNAGHNHPRIVLVVPESQIAEFVSAVRQVIELAHHPVPFWSEALGLSRRAVVS